ncbi:unnamed protein product [Linum trigynum]|uniref:Uncharacterized protein n=1 Tax=Linum trigynum TaxID=586398 RepID=A0AAV2CTX8_9ROSI
MLPTATALDHPPPMAMNLTGRPSDHGGQQLIPPTEKASALNFKAALLGTTTTPLEKNCQWTFIGDRDLESFTHQGQPALKISPAQKDRLWHYANPGGKC